MAISKKRSSETGTAHAPREGNTSPQAAMLFLKQGALEREWTRRYIASALRIDAPTAKQVAAELTLMGYAEPVPRELDTWWNAEVGNKVAGVREGRGTIDGCQRPRR